MYTHIYNFAGLSQMKVGSVLLNQSTNFSNQKVVDNG
jgi:hypothetical protein